MKFPKIVSLLLAAVMLFALCACGETTIESYADTGSSTTTSTAMDWDAAFAMYDPDTIIFTVDDVGVTWQELFYEVAYYYSYLSYLEGTTITDWSAACTLYTDEDGNYYTYGAVVLQNAVSMLFQYHALYSHLIAEGVALGEEGQQAVAELRQATIDDSFDGDEEAFLEYLESMYCTEEIWDWLNEVDAMYAYDGFDTIYGEFGSDFSDEDVMTYAAGDPDGAWTEYVQIKQIYLYDTEEEDEEETEETDEDAEEVEETVDEATEEITEASEELSTVETILAALDASDDLDATFAELYDAYNENPNLDPFTDGWCLYQGDTDDAIYEAALDLDDYGYTVVDIDGAQVIVMKVPIDPDAGVYYDADADTMYTLRYYAAWQDYADLINYDWIANAEGDWVEGFEDFNLATLFAEAVSDASTTDATE